MISRTIAIVLLTILLAGLMSGCVDEKEQPVPASSVPVAILGIENTENGKDYTAMKLEDYPNCMTLNDTTLTINVKVNVSNRVNWLWAFETTDPLYQGYLKSVDSPRVVTNGTYDVHVPFNSESQVSNVIICLFDEGGKQTILNFDEPYSWQLICSQAHIYVTCPTP